MCEMSSPQRGFKSPGDLSFYAEGGPGIPSYVMLMSQPARGCTVGNFSAGTPRMTDEFLTLGMRWISVLLDMIHSNRFGKKHLLL